MKILVKSFLLVLLMILKCNPVYAAVIEKPVADMIIIRMPDRREIDINERVDLTGLQVEVRFTDGTSYVANAEDFTVDDFDRSTEGSKRFIVRYGKYPLALAVNVKKGVLNRIEVLVENKTRYVGDEITNEDFRVIGHYDTGSKELQEYTIDTPKLTSEQTVVNVQYGDIISQVVVFAIRNSCVGLRVEADNIPTYSTREVFSVRDVRVFAQYVKGDDIDITNKCKYTAPDISVSGEHVVTVEFESLSTWYTVKSVEFTFVRADASMYDLTGEIQLYFKERAEPVTVNSEIWESIDYSTNTKRYTILWNGGTYYATVELPSEEKKFMGSMRVTVQVPVALNVRISSGGVLGYLSNFSLSNNSKKAIKIMTKDLVQVIGFPLECTLPSNSQNIFDVSLKTETCDSSFVTTVNTILEVLDE